MDVNGEVKLNTYVKIQKKKFFFFFLGGVWSGGVRFRGGGVRVDGNGELKLL